MCHLAGVAANERAKAIQPSHDNHDNQRRVPSSFLNTRSDVDDNNKKKYSKYPHTRASERERAREREENSFSVALAHESDGHGFPFCVVVNSVES